MNFPRFVSCWGVVFVACAVSALAQMDPVSSQRRSLTNHETFCARFKAGDTNLPLLRIDILEWPLRGASVSKEGKIAGGWHSGISNSRVDGTLAGTNFELLVKAIIALPPSGKESIPLDRQMHVSVVRSNECSHLVYDVKRRPKEVEALCDILGWPFASPKTPERKESPSVERPRIIK